MWFRRDLRDFDHAALYHALKAARRSIALSCSTAKSSMRCPRREDRRVEFIWESVAELASSLAARGGTLLVRHASPVTRSRNLPPSWASPRYTPITITSRRPGTGTPTWRKRLASRGISFNTAKDHVIFERDEVLSQAGKPFSVFTPYKNAWLKKLTPFHRSRIRSMPMRPHLRRRPRPWPLPFRRWKAWASGAPTCGVGVVPGMTGGGDLFADFRTRIDRYRDARDFPARKGPSYLSVHLRFGTVSIRELAAYAHSRSLQPDGEGAATWLSELIWREFYAQILWHHPRVSGEAFKPEYAGLRFPGEATHFDAWCEGRTGYPIVDAAMRQLNATGYMHNRLRMIVASFLVKDLLVDWRLGEKYFAERLIDFDLASNNGGWQWAASTGCDAQPYFRIFNPVTQSERFDPDGKFIRRYVPELAQLDAAEIHAPWQVPPAIQQAKGVVIGRDYPAPIVDHAAARARALALFSRGK